MSYPGEKSAYNQENHTRESGAYGNPSNQPHQPSPYPPSSYEYGNEAGAYNQSPYPQAIQVNSVAPPPPPPPLSEMGNPYQPQSSIPVATGVYTVNNQTSNPLPPPMAPPMQAPGLQVNRGSHPPMGPGVAPPPILNGVPGEGFQGNGGPTIVQVVSLNPQFGTVPTHFTCKYCQYVGITRVKKQTGGATWLSCCGLALVGCVYGCCLIPFCTDCTKDTEHVCPNCNNVVGRKNIF